MSEGFGKQVVDVLIALFIGWWTLFLGYLIFALLDFQPWNMPSYSLWVILLFAILVITRYAPGNRFRNVICFIVITFLFFLHSFLNLISHDNFQAKVWAIIFISFIAIVALVFTFIITGLIANKYPIFLGKYALAGNDAIAQSNFNFGRLSLAVLAAVIAGVLLDSIRAKLFLLIITSQVIAIENIILSGCISFTSGFLLPYILHKILAQYSCRNNLAYGFILYLGISSIISRPIQSIFPDLWKLNPEMISSLAGDIIAYISVLECCCYFLGFLTVLMFIKKR